MMDTYSKDNLALDPNCILEASCITHKFDYKLFNNINLSFFKKQSVSILGESGSGKSTLLNILSSLLAPNNGKVIYDALDLYSLSNTDLLNIRRRYFGIIFQAHYLFRGFTAKDNLNISSFLSSNSIDYELLNKLGILNVINQNVGELSGGQQQRLSIARVLNKKPKIIFADEPTGNLDKKTSLYVMNILFEYIKEYNSSLVLVTHEEDIAFSCDRVYSLVDNNLKVLK
jgi:putative ABC transport system ATP-binding protein